MNGQFNVLDDNFRTDVVTHKLNQTRGLNIAGATVFDEVVTAEYSPDIAINPTNGLTDYRLIQTTSNGGTIAEDGGTFRLRTGTTANGSAALETAEHGDYNSGSMALAGCLAFASREPTGNEDLTWGYYDDSDGFQVGWDATGYYLRLRSGGVDGSKVRPSSWLDPLDGTGDSGATLDFLKPTIARLKMALYGEGPCEIEFLMEGANGVPVYVTAYRFWADAGALVIQNWGLPVKADATNGGDTTSIDLHIGGMQFGVIGRRREGGRTATEDVIGKSLSGTTIVPIISFRKKSSSEAVNCLAREFEVESADSLIVYVILGGSLTGASYGSLTDIQDSETALEVDTSATAISGGNAVYKTIHVGGSGNQNAVSDEGLRQALPNGVPITLAARLQSGSGGTGTFLFKIRERW